MQMRSVLLAAVLVAAGLHSANGQARCGLLGGTCPNGGICVLGNCGQQRQNCNGNRGACTNGLLCIGGQCVLGGGGTGDPIMKGFDGREWEFLGKPDSTYALYSDELHAVNMRLFLGQMFNHNGTYIGGMGFQYKQQQFAVDLVDNGDIKLTMEGIAYPVNEDSDEGLRKFGLRENSVSVEWTAHEPGFGRSVTFSTGTLQMKVWAVPAGLLDKGGKPQPAYLNFQTALLASPPGDEAQGLVGETLMSLTPTAESTSHTYSLEDHSFHGRGAEADYEVKDLFDTNFKFSLFKPNKATATSRKRRSALESAFASVDFPLLAGTHAYVA